MKSVTNKKKTAHINNLQQIVSNLTVRPELLHKKAHGADLLRADSELISAISHRQDVLADCEVGTDGNVERARLSIEMLDVENRLYYRKKTYEHYCKRVQDNEVWFRTAVEECEINFDNMINASKKVSETNPRLAGAISGYTNPDNDQQMKVEFYYLMKQEVLNAGIKVESSEKVSSS